MNRWLACVAGGLSSAAAALGRPGLASEATARVQPGGAGRPRLVVVIVVDQLRADLLPRCEDLFLPARDGATLGGFRYLMSEGAYFVNAHHEHWPTVTAPGHAAILTGGTPARTGIIGNDWWDPREHRVVSAVEDARWAAVGAAAGSAARGAGPHLLRSTTVGDELKLATAGRAKVVSLSLKERAAIFLGGHGQDVCLWFDTAGGRWISSSAFCRDGRLPAWVEKINDERLPDRVLGASWTPIVPVEALAARSIVPKVVGAGMDRLMGARFPHTIGDKKTAANYIAFENTPAANEFVFHSAVAAIEAESLGADEITDVLALSLSANDLVGHAFGPFSPEVIDMTVQTDRQLSKFVNLLESRVGLQNVVIVLTADHGVAPIPEDAAGAPFNNAAGRFKYGDVTGAVNRALTARFGEPAGESWFSMPTSSRGVERRAGMFIEWQMYLSVEAIERAIADGKARGRRDFEEAACDAVNGGRIKGIQACYGRTQILEGRVGDRELASRLGCSIDPQRSGDLMVIPEAFYLPERTEIGNATTHGTPYAYDTHVPVIVCAPGLVQPGVYSQRVSPTGIAPTLSLMLGIEFPSGCVGQPLPGVP